MAKFQEEFLKGSLITTVETESCICLDTVERNHKTVEREDFKILGKGYITNAVKLKISEALYCRELKAKASLAKWLSVRLRTKWF